MDYELASRELVRALRGSRSQTAARRRLKRSSNVFHAWETGARYPRSTDLLELLQSTGRSPALVLGRFTPCQGATLAALLSSFLAALVRDRSHAELARQVGVNRNTVARWLSGQTEPRVPQLLALVEATTQRVLEFLAELVEPGGVPSVAAAQADLQRQRRLAYTRPWAHAVLRALELTQYRALARHLPGFLASSTGIDLEEEEACLEALLLTKQVRRRSGRYRVGRVLAVDTRADPAGNLALKRHWFQVASERLAKSGIPAGGLASYNLFAIAEADLERVRQAHLDYYERVRSIVAESKEPSRVVLVTVGLLPLGPGDSSRRPRPMPARSG